MQNVFIVFGESNEVIAAISTEGYIEELLQKALSSHHGAVGGATIADLRKCGEALDGTQRWTYTIDLGEDGMDIKEVYLDICGYYA